MTSWNFLKQTVLSKNISPQFSESEECYFIKAFDGSILIDECVIIKNLHLEDKIDFEENFKSTANKPNSIMVGSIPSSASKHYGNNKLFKRVVGVREDVIEGLNVIDWISPFPWAKFIEMQFTNTEIGDYICLEVYDTPEGTYSGIPDFKLNQFGFTVNVPNGFYSHKSEFDADIYFGMIIRLSYHTINNKKIGMNFVLNEVKP
jgi:hypothetical protein